MVQAAATSSFEWRGLRTTLPLEKLRVPLHAAKELAAGLSSAMDTGVCVGGGVSRGLEGGVVCVVSCDCGSEFVWAPGWGDDEGSSWGERGGWSVHHIATEKLRVPLHAAKELCVCVCFGGDVCVVFRAGWGCGGGG